jgi:hypothetical protein
MIAMKKKVMRHRIFYIQHPNNKGIILFNVLPKLMENISQEKRKNYLQLIYAKIKIKIIFLLIIMSIKQKTSRQATNLR